VKKKYVGVMLEEGGVKDRQRRRDMPAATSSRDTNWRFVNAVSGV
jgi:hypothetical protein